MENKKKQSSEKQVHEDIKPLFEDMGNTHIHDEKSYNELKNK